MKHFLKRMTAVLLSATLVFGETPVTSMNTYAAGPMVMNIVAGQIGGFVFGLVLRTTAYGLSSMSDATTSDDMSKVLTWAQRILVGNSGNMAKTTLKEVKKISAELNAFFSYEVKANGEIEDKLDQVLKKID